MAEIRPFDPARDAEPLHALWQTTLARDWPLAAEDFAGVMRDGVVAVDGGGLAGAALANRDGARASLQLVVVAPERRRQGLGTRLHETLVSSLAAAGVTSVRLGGTPGAYLWPGLPASVPGARAALERWGWRFGEECWDLVRSLRGYETPAGIETPAGVVCRRATSADREPLLAFERAHFPHWAPYFESDDGVADAVLALAGDRIVGTLHARDSRRTQLWRGLLGDDCGEIGAVGVDGPARERGVGTALVAYASELLRDAGVDRCLIAWTGLLSFYGRLGYEPWREYETAELELVRLGDRPAIR